MSDVNGGETVANDLPRDAQGNVRLFDIAAQSAIGAAASSVPLIYGRVMTSGEAAQVSQAASLACIAANLEAIARQLAMLSGVLDQALAVAQTRKLHLP